MALDALAGAYHAAGQHETAREVHIDRLLPLLVEELRADTTIVGMRRLLGNVANTLIRLGEREKAAEILDLSEKQERDKKLRNMAGILDALAYLTQARGYVTKEGLAAASGYVHADDILVMIRKAQLYELNGDDQRAIDLLKDASEKAEQLLGPDHYSTIAPLHELGRLLNKCNEFHSALPVNERVYQWRAKQMGDLHPDTLRAGQNYAHSLVELRSEQAVDLCRTILEHKNRVPDMGTESVLRAAVSLVRALLDAGDVAECREVLDRYAPTSAEGLLSGQQTELAGLRLELELTNADSATAAVEPLRRFFDASVPQHSFLVMASVLLGNLPQNLSRHQDENMVITILRFTLEAMIRIAPSYGDDAMQLMPELGRMLVANMVSNGEWPLTLAVNYLTREYFDGDEAWLKV